MYTEKRRIPGLQIAVSVLIAATTFCALVTGCGRKIEAVVARRDIIAYLPLGGEVGVPPGYDVKVGTLYQAPVARINVTVGAMVRKGDVIMELSAPNNQANYQQARQNVLQARQQLRQAGRPYDAEVAAAKQAYDNARQAEVAARKQAQTPQAVPADGQVTITETPDLAAATEQRQQAALALRDAQARRNAALATYQQQVVQAEQQLADAQSGLKAAMVRAPITGTVLEINVQPGQVVGQKPDEALARVVDLTAVKIYAPLDDKYLSEIQPKDPAEVTLSDLPDEKFTGMVDQVYSRKAKLPWDADYVAVVDFYNRQGLAKPGMKAEASVKLGEVDNVLAVPASAVYETGDQTAVRIVQGQNTHERIVETGLSDGKYTEIKSGLKEGDVVLASR